MTEIEGTAPVREHIAHGHIERLSTWQAAYVIARRDFTAILFSKAFLFFLIGPLFFIAISVGAGFLGAKAADSADEPRLAVALSADESARFAASWERTAELVTLPRMEVVAPNRASDMQALLADDEANVAAVLTLSLIHI